MNNSDLEQLQSEKLSAKETLKRLEDTNKYLFHGSFHQVEVFTPRQAYTIENGKRVPDGPPAVFASTRSEPAIFKAIINRYNDPSQGHQSGWEGIGEGKMRYWAVRSALEKAREGVARGFVYVFKKEDFNPRQGHEYTVEHEVKPLMQIVVTGKDLPEDITEIEPIPK